MSITSDPPSNEANSQQTIQNGEAEAQTARTATSAAALTSSNSFLKNSLGETVPKKRLEAAQADIAIGRSIKDSDEEDAGSQESDNEVESDEEESKENLKRSIENEYTLVHKTQQRLAKALYERSQFIPLRLGSEERQRLRILEGTLSVSEYTDKVDILVYGSKAKRIAAQIEEICALLSGLMVTVDYDRGKSLINGKQYQENEQYFQDIFEIGRRHKIMNPEKMRTEYGKLIYMLQDAMSTDVQRLLGFNAKKPIKTVFSFLKDRGILSFLSDELLPIATQEIIDDGTKSRQQLRAEGDAKRQAAEKLVQKYSSPIRGDDEDDEQTRHKRSRDDDDDDDDDNEERKSNGRDGDQKEVKVRATAEEIRRCLRSIGDNGSFLRSNCDSLDRMIFYLKHYFPKNGVANTKWSLSITAGRGGARLSHRHEYQYEYVLQSLILWKEIQLEMFKLWYLTERDLLLENNYYRLMNTGQGLNRMQRAPNVGAAMAKIIHQTQQQLTTGWAGSSVVHLGDTNVPNALMFIDKYTQVPRIINPIILTITELDRIVADEGIRMYVDATFGSVEDAKKIILQDFFKHGFDGSGADNFFEAGSCIDGRLTSAWNWCSKISEKLYYPLFRLTGFVGFDGDFQK